MTFGVRYIEVRPNIWTSCRLFL